MKARLYKLDGEKNNFSLKDMRKYTKDELAEMTTFQLRDICFREKLVTGMISALNREALIKTILKYLGAEESLLIKNFKQGGFEKVEAVLKKYLITPLPGNANIKIPARITLYKGLDVDRQDMYRVEAGDAIKAESNILLVNDNYDLCGILNLVNEGSQNSLYYLTAKKELELRKTGNKNYSFLFFKKLDSEYIYKTYYSEQDLPPTNLHYYKVPVADLEIRELEKTRAVLAMDFGTSFTTAGAYLEPDYVSSPCSNDILNGRIKLNEINFVRFMEGKNNTEQGIELLPTVVSIVDCSNPEDIKYRFGYEALNCMKKHDYNYNASVFHAIKRWVNNYTKLEEVVDEQGYVANVPRSDILKAYLIHVIKTAEHQFKCRFQNLHISSPVKLKQQFLDMFKDILSDYTIETDNALDEGIAVLYNTIADQIEKNSFNDGEEYKALIIDCGGGTTDLSSCRFKIEDGRISYKIDIHTTYENGDINFGGNNITYRIMQFVKIVFADYYTKHKNIQDIDSLIDIPSADIFRYVDEFGVEKVYERLEERYLEAERIIPTRFRDYENRSRDEYQMVRNNFYFLWEISESMKKEFFHKTGILRNRFNSQNIKQQESDLKITALDKWCLSIMDNGSLANVCDFPDVVFNIKEISKLINADIYEIVRKFLEEFYLERKLQEYSIIKLTGQSCRIDAFKDALKEFVPGKSIEFRQKANDNENVLDLKLSCLKGVLRYLNSKNVGYIEANITNNAHVIPYSVTAYTHTMQEIVLISILEKQNQIQGFISRPKGTAEMEFYLKGADGSLRHKYIYRNEAANYQPVMYSEIAKEYDKKIPQHDTDTIINGEAKFFVYASENNWGFHVVPVAREEEQLLLGKQKFFAFENDIWELDYFDGFK